MNKINKEMDINLSRRKRDELKRKNEELKKEEYDKYVGELDELYFDLYSDEYSLFYDFFIDLMEKKFYCIKNDYKNYNDFKIFVDGYSRHKDEFKDKKINDYLDEETSEEEIEEDFLENDFFLRKGERF